MGLLSVLRKFIKTKQEPPGFSIQGTAHGGEYDFNEYKEPSRPFTSSHSGNYDPNEKKKPSQTAGDSHGGDYKPNQYKNTVSDHRNDNGGDYRPDRTGHSKSPTEGQRPEPSHGGHHETNSRQSHRSRRRARRDTTNP